jgi:hypothetical protein
MVLIPLILTFSQREKEFTANPAEILSLTLLGQNDNEMALFDDFYQEIN